MKKKAIWESIIYQLFWNLKNHTFHIHINAYILKRTQLCVLPVDYISYLFLHIMKEKLVVLQVQAMASVTVVPGKAVFVKIVERLFWAVSLWTVWVARQAFANTLRVGQNIKNSLGNKGKILRKADLSDNICQGIK